MAAEVWGRLTKTDNATLREEVRASEIVDRLCDFLHNKDKDSMSKLVRDAYEGVLPALKAGRHINPIHHTPQVVEFLVQIMLEEQDFKESALKQGIVAAMFHDSGNAFEPKGEKKIMDEDVNADLSLREPAIEQRRRHMMNGAMLAELFMRAQGSPTFTQNDISVVTWIIEHHDDPTIAELMDEKEKEAYLFGHDPEPRNRLAAIHREADRLWMLSIGGLVTDMKRKAEKGKPWYPQAQITHNAIRHQEERALYEEAFATRIKEFDFEPFSAFYRTKEGKKLFTVLQQKARELLPEEWTTLMLET